jgi:hypothetical protein
MRLRAIGPLFADDEGTIPSLQPKGGRKASPRLLYFVRAKSSALSSFLGMLAAQLVQRCTISSGRPAGGHAARPRPVTTQVFAVIWARNSDALHIMSPQERMIWVSDILFNSRARSR